MRDGGWLRVAARAQIVSSEYAVGGRAVSARGSAGCVGLPAAQAFWPDGLDVEVRLPTACLSRGSLAGRPEAELGRQVRAAAEHGDASDADLRDGEHAQPVGAVAVVGDRGG